LAVPTQLGSRLTSTNRPDFKVFVSMMGSQIPLDFDEPVRHFGFNSTEWLSAAALGLVPCLAIANLLPVFVVIPGVLVFIKTVLHSQHRGSWRRQLHTFGWRIKGMVPAHSKTTIYRVVSSSE